MQKSIVPQVALYQETYELLLDLVGESGLSPEHLVEELVNYDYYSLYGDKGRATGKDKDIPQTRFYKRHIPIRAQTYERFQDLLRTHRYTSENLIYLATKYHNIVVHTEYARDEHQISIYQDTFTRLAELADEDSVSPEILLQRFIHMEYLLRYSTFENPITREPRYPKGRIIYDRPFPKISVSISDAMYAKFTMLLTEDCLTEEELLGDIVGYQNVARHVHFVKAFHRYAGFRCGRKDCYIQY